VTKKEEIEKANQYNAARKKLQVSIQDVYTTFWSLFDNTDSIIENEIDLQSGLEKKILDLFKLSAYEGRKVFSRIVYRQVSQKIYASDAGKSVNWLLKFSNQLPDPMIQKILSRSIILRGNINMLSQLASVRTKIPVDLCDKASITKDHVKCLKLVIMHMGMHDINADFRYSKNLIHIASINEELATTLEEHMLKKARRYKNFYHLVGYMESCPTVDKRKFFVEIFKHKTHYNARIAIERLKKHPELHKYFNLT